MAFTGNQRKSEEAEINNGIGRKSGKEADLS
jgi:hypothetical protein